MKPWYKNINGPLPNWKGPVGVKEDGGGNTRGCGLIGTMAIHRAVCNHDEAEIARLVDLGHNVDEVEAAGNTPLHNAAYEGWVRGAEILISYGAKVNASNNAGDRPFHWAENMGWKEMMDFLAKAGADKRKGNVLVQEHVPKVKDFFSKDCWAHHPKPYADFVEAKEKEDTSIEAAKKKAIRI